MNRINAEAPMNQQAIQRMSTMEYPRTHALSRVFPFAYVFILGMASDGCLVLNRLMGAIATSTVQRGHCYQGLAETIAIPFNT